MFVIPITYCPISKVWLAWDVLHMRWVDLKH